ncbi:MAG: TonB-dependent receptor [Sphingobacteriaceae bacterium]|nr:MAG: TonB-dependent receptor [Sphingobacteriaceae bacterium]
MKLNITYIYNFLKPQALVVSLLLLPVIALAQNDTTKNLNEVKVSTSAIPVLQTIVPAQQITNSDFTRYNAFNVADAIRNFAGVSIKDYGGIGGLKTVSIRGLGANHTAILFDGIQINDAENGQVDLGKLNLNNVQEISLYNGQPPYLLQPARSFAAASVLSIKTIKPLLNAVKPYQITAGVRAGSFGLFNPYLQWQQRLSKTWGFVLNGYTQYANGKYPYKIHNGNATTQQTRLSSAISAQQIDGAIYWAKNDSNKFNLRVNYYNSDRGLPGPVVLYTPPPSGQRLWNEDLFIQSTYQHSWRSGFNLLLNAKFSKNNLRYVDPQFPNTAGFLDQRFTQREYYQSAALSYHILPNWEVSYAADLAITNMTSDRPNFKYPTRTTLLNVVATNLVLSKVTLQVSLLNTNIRETVRTGTTVPNTNVYSPTIMATLRPFNDQSFKVRGYYKYIFRVPTFNELYYGYVTNTNLKPEFTNQYDLGLSYNKALTGWLDYIGFTADAYYNNVTNKIVYTPNTYNGSVQNFGKVDIKGLDVSVKTQANISRKYKALISVNYSYQNAQDVTDPTSSTYLNQLPYIPKNTVAINAGINRGPIGVYYNQLISSSRYFTNNNLPDSYLALYAIGDISAVYKGLINRLPVMLSVEVNNVFNKDYVVIQSYPMPGRSFRISFQITI